MLSLSYYISYELRKSLDSSDALRQKILLTPISPKNASKMKWEFMIRRIHYAFMLRGYSLDSETIIKIITRSQRPATTQLQIEVVKYRQVLNFIAEEWTANTSPITYRNIKNILSMISLDDKRDGLRLNKSQEEIQHLLDYLQPRPDHPVILAAIMYVKILEMQPLLQNNDLFASLIATMILNKYGFDVQGWLTFEEFFYKNIEKYKIALQETFNKSKMTIWMEFYAVAIETQLIKIATSVNLSQQKLASPSFWKLTDRQREILNLFQEPGSRITNQKVQKVFGISQITASRDLSKLASLELLYGHGKGRSVYYIRAY